VKIASRTIREKYGKWLDEGFSAGQNDRQTPFVTPKNLAGVRFI